MALTLLRFASRNICRNGRRSILTILAMAGGLFVLVFLKALQDGYVAQRLDLGLGLSLGHLVIKPAVGSDGVAGSIGDGNAVAKALTSDPAVIAAAARIRFEAFVQSAESAAGISVLGVDPAAERAATLLPQAVVEGKFFDSVNVTETPSIVIGGALARRLGVSLGDKVTLLVQAEDRAFVAEPFKLVGIFQTGGVLFDSAVAYVPRHIAARMVLLRGDATEVIARIHDPLEAPRVVARAERKPALVGLRIQSWQDAAPEMMEAMEVLRIMELIRTAVLFALVGVGIFNTVTMALYERRREFGVLMSIGMSPLAVFGLLVIEVALLAFAGVLIGMGSSVGIVSGWLGRSGISVSVLGARLPGALGGTTVIYPVVGTENLITAGAWVAAISLAVLVVPLYRILRLEPATALRDRP